jgi:pyruvate kinase
MSRIAERTEGDIDYEQRMIDRYRDAIIPETTMAISHAACTVAQDIHADAIIAVTMSGFTAERLSRFKPTCPIVACSTESRVAYQTNLLFDTIPLVIKQEEDAEALFESAIHQAELAGIIRHGSKVVLTAGLPLGVSGKTNMIRVEEV